jgi:type II secretory pathway component GspD/PulD (secretin)
MTLPKPFPIVKRLTSVGSETVQQLGKALRSSLGNHSLCSKINVVWGSGYQSLEDQSDSIPSAAEGFTAVNAGARNSPARKPVSKFFSIAFGCLAAIWAWPICAQVPAASPSSTPETGLQPLPQFSASPAPTPNGEVTPTPNEEVTPVPTPSQSGPNTEPGNPMRNTENSFWLDNYPLNDLFQYLAHQAGYQYFQNPYVAEFKVSGELFKGHDPLESMRELALQYNLVLFRKGSTLYALRQEQIDTLPQHEYRYELKYLHPKPEDIQRMLGHFLTPGKGIATLEPQINTIVVSDNETVIPKINQYLRSIDVPRRQISIQVRVISITTTGDKTVGVDWSRTFGQQGLALSGTMQANLDATFGFNPVAFKPSTSITGSTAQAVNLANQGTNVILGPVTVTAVLHALLENNWAHAENAPLVIAEDNQPSAIRVVTRQPIVYSTVTSTTAGPEISSDVRYYLDPSDVSKNREIGTTLLVTPTILPDKTIRLQIDGTVSTVVSEVLATTGIGSTSVTNSYPVVNEAHLVNLSRVPNGYSLILGGFVTINNSISNNKVPILGNIPLIGNAFRFKFISRSRTNLAFIITPIAFQAGNPERATAVSEQNRESIIGPEHDLAEPNLIGRVNRNAPDFRYSTATGQYQESGKDPVRASKKAARKEHSHAKSTESQSPNPVDP